jgi:hypothetical protein
MISSKKMPLVAAAIAAALGVAACASNSTPQSDMSFFVTSVGSGKGADLGGLAGADKHCQALAQAAGAGGKTWRAYLSTSGAGSVNARDRIGSGPWQNAKGVVVAYNVDELHGANNLTKQTALTEKGMVVNGRGDTPNTHDAVTGSTVEGRAFPATPDMTCGNYTKSGADGAVMLGHIDRIGLTEDDVARSWNSSHASRGGCSQPALVSTGGAGLFYCFAVR